MRASRFLAGVEELIDQVLFDSDIAGQHVRDESIGHGALLVQQLRHLSLADAQDGARRERRGASHAKRLTSQAPLAEEVHGGCRCTPSGHQGRNPLQG